MRSSNQKDHHWESLPRECQEAREQVLVGMIAEARRRRHELAAQYGHSRETYAHIQNMEWSLDARTRGWQATMAEMRRVPVYNLAPEDMILETPGWDIGHAEMLARCAEIEAVRTLWHLSGCSRLPGEDRIPRFELLLQQRAWQVAALMPADLRGAWLSNLSQPIQEQT